jgi:Cu(I)/Ag(I) efflux system membrane fusion protein
VRIAVTESQNQTERETERPIDSPESLRRPASPRGGRGFGPGVLLLVALLGAAAGAAATLALVRHGALAGGAAPAAEAGPTLYQCPMHPSIVQDHPGDCPICGMKLVKMEARKPAPVPTPADQPRVLYYRSPMDPKQTSPTPRKDEMGMDYVPVYEGEVGGETLVAGMADVEIDPARQQLIGLKTERAERGAVSGTWRTVGRVAIDETRVRHVNLKVPGFVERIYVDFVGKKVKKGDPLFSIYSPELLAAQEEYLLVLRTSDSLASAGAAAGDGAQLVAAARRKLALWDVPESEIERIARTGQPSKTLTFYSPAAGVVTRKEVVEGMKLDAGAMPYEIVDLSSVWVLADVYESELRFVKEGMTATLRLNAFPSREFGGQVVFVDPLLDPATRTVKVRLTFPNPTGELRPEMFGEVLLQGAAHEGLLIPVDAVIDSGTEKVVFVAVGAGKFEPHTIELGVSDGRSVEVTAGLDEGERVVTRANFLVDSESRLRASLAEMAPEGKTPDSARVLPGTTPPPSATPSDTPAPAPTPPPAADHGGHTMPAPAPPEPRP